jgi:hypothetical protein
MDVEIDEPRGNDLSLDLDDFGIGRREAGRITGNGRNPAVFDQDVGDLVAAAGRIDDPAAGEQECAHV